MKLTRAADFWAGICAGAGSCCLFAIWWPLLLWCATRALRRGPEGVSKTFLTPNCTAPPPAFSAARSSRATCLIGAALSAS